MEFVKSKHRFFDALVAFLCNYTGVTMALEAQQKGSVVRFGAGDRVGFMAQTAGYTIVFETEAIMNAVSKGEWVDKVAYEIIPIPKILPEKVIHQTGRVHKLSAQALFVQFYDSVEDLAEARHNDSLVRFSKSIRNASAHGGVFKKLDDRGDIQWKNLKLKSADNGKTLLEVGINPGDLIVLMQELNDYLK